MNSQILLTGITGVTS